MISISQSVEEIVNQSPYMREALTEKLINLSSLARKIQPQIQNELRKSITQGSVVIALQRYVSQMKPYYQVNPADYLANLGLRSDLFEMTVKNSSELLTKLAKISKNLETNFASVFIFTQGFNETSIITSKSLQSTLEIELKNEEIVNIIPDLTGISLQRTHGQIETTGVLQFPLRILAWEGISVIEIYTTLNEIMVLVRDFEVDKAISAIRVALKKPFNGFNQKINVGYQFVF